MAYDEDDLYNEQYERIRDLLDGYDRSWYPDEYGEH